MEQAANTRMTKDAIIKELIELLNQNQQREAANNVFEMAALLDNMEQKLELMTQELVNVRSQLEKMDQEKADKSLKAVVRKAADSLELRCDKMKGQLSAIKTEVKAKASEIVAEAKAKGKAALHRVSEFLGIKDKLESVRENVHKSIAETEHTINKLDAFGSGMREAGQKIANTFRVFVDKPEKECGDKQLSKTELLKKPFQVKRKLLFDILNCADAAIEKTQQLATEVNQHKTDKGICKAANSVDNIEAANPAELAVVAEQEFQYGAEVFEAYQKDAAKAMATDKGIKKVPVKSGKSR